MNGRHGVWMVPLLAAAACDGLRERPGHDFSVAILDHSPIEVVGQIYAPVHFGVAGCGAFELTLEDVMGARHPLPFTPREDGTFDASVPVFWMGRYPAFDNLGSWCWNEDEHPLPPTTGALIVECKDVGRTARAELSVSRVTATKFLSWFYPTVAIFPSDDPLQPWSVTARGAGGGLYLGPPRSGIGFPVVLDWEARALSPLVRPRLARRGDRLFATLGCEPNQACPQPKERLVDVSLADGPGAPPRGMAHVPSSVIDIAHAADGSLMVLSQTGDLTGMSKNTSTILTRVEPAPDGVQGVAEDRVTIVSELPGQVPLGRFARTEAGQLMFLTMAYPETTGPIQGVLHSTDGQVLDEVMTVGELGNVTLSGMTIGGWADLSPDASIVIVGQDRDVFLMSTDPAHPAREEIPYQSWRSWGMGGTVWLPGAIVIWYPAAGSFFGGVSVYDATPPHALRWSYEVDALPGTITAPTLLDVTAVGDKLALSTSTGIRILGPDGRLVGGSDPFPCGGRTQASAVATGPSTVAIGVDRGMYVFDVGP